MRKKKKSFKYDHEKEGACLLPLMGHEREKKKKQEKKAASTREGFRGNCIRRGQTRFQLRHGDERNAHLQTESVDHRSGVPEDTVREFRGRGGKLRGLRSTA